MATGDKEQVLVALEVEMSDLKDLIELAKERGFNTPLAAMTRDLKQAEAEWPKSSH
jgi:hypothetical protein